MMKNLREKVRPSFQRFIKSLKIVHHKSSSHIFFSEPALLVLSAKTYTFLCKTNLFHWDVRRKHLYMCEIKNSSAGGEGMEKVRDGERDGKVIL